MAEKCHSCGSIAGSNDDCYSCFRVRNPIIKQTATAGKVD